MAKRGRTRSLAKVFTNGAANGPENRRDLNFWKPIFRYAQGLFRVLGEPDFDFNFSFVERNPRRDLVFFFFPVNLP